MGPHFTYPFEGCFDMHIYPGIPSAAIDCFVSKNGDPLSELVPPLLKEMLESGQV